eukprot:2444582-Pleurochrysis_carterae.AAC.1
MISNHCGARSAQSPLKELPPRQLQLKAVMCSQTKQGRQVGEHVLLATELRCCRRLRHSLGLSISLLRADWPASDSASATAACVRINLRKSRIYKFVDTGLNN